MIRRRLHTVAVVLGFASASLAQSTTTKNFGPGIELDLESNLSLTSVQWTKFLGAEFDERLSIGGITGKPDTVIIPFPEVTADTRTGVKITGRASGRAGLEVGGGFDLGDVNAHGKLQGFGPTLSYPTQLMVGRVYTLQGGASAGGVSNDFKVDLPTITAGADAVLDFHVDGRVEYGLFPLVPYDVALFDFELPNLNLNLFDFDLNLNLPELPNLSFLGFDLPELPSLPNEDDSLFRFKIPPKDPTKSFGEVQLVDPLKNWGSSTSVDGGTARYQVEGDLIRLGADLDGLITYSLYGNAILGTEIDIKNLGKLKYELIDFKYGPELGFKYEAEITPKLEATLNFSSDVLVQTDQGFMPTKVWTGDWNDIPEIVLIKSEDITVDVKFNSAEMMMQHRGALTLADYLEIRALELSASLKTGFGKIPLGKLGPVIDKKFSPLGDLFGELELEVFDDMYSIGLYDLSALGLNDSFTLNAAPLVLAYAVDSTGPLDAASDWRRLDNHTQPASLASTTLVIASGDTSASALDDLQPLSYTDRPSMITKTYTVDIFGIPVPIDVTHQDFDRNVILQGFHVPKNSTYEVPSNTVRNLRLVSLHNDGLIQSSGFFELTSPGIFLAVSGEGTIDLERAASISVQNMLVDAGQTIRLSNPGQFNINVNASTPFGNVRVAQFTRNGFTFDVTGTLDMGGELLVDGASLNLRALERLNIGPQGALRAVNGSPAFAVTTPLLVNEGVMEATDGSYIDLFLTQPSNGPAAIRGGSGGGDFIVRDGGEMSVASSPLEFNVNNARFTVENGGELLFQTRMSVEPGGRFDLVVEEGGRAELSGLLNRNEAEGFVTITNHGLLELTSSLTSLRPRPEFVEFDPMAPNQFLPTDFVNQGTLRVVGDQSGNTQTSFEFNATIVNFVGGGAALVDGRWELLGAPVDFNNDSVPGPLDPNGVATIDVNVTDVKWDERIVREVEFEASSEPNAFDELSEPNGELWYNDAEVVFSGAARWLYFNTLRENRGLLEIRDRHRFRTAGDFTNSGDLNVANDAELDVTGRFTNRGGTTIVSDGSELNASGGVHVEGGLVRVDVDALVDGFEASSNALLSGSEWVVQDVSTVDPDNPDVVTVEPAVLDLVGREVERNLGNVRISGAEASFNAIRSIHSNLGSLTISDGHQFDNTPAIGTDLTNSGRLEATAGGQITIDGGISNHGGEVIVGAESYLSASEIQFINGSLHVDGLVATDAVNISPNATLSGSGIVRGRVVDDVIQDTVVENNGTVNPGNSPGTLQVTGDYMQSADATLAIEIDGFVGGSGRIFDQLEVSGNATMDGLLDVTLSDGFGLSQGDEFTVLAAELLLNNGLELVGSGAEYFDMIVEPGVPDLPGIPGIPGRIALQFRGGDFMLPGDYNDDGTVDASDYVVWRNTQGQTGANLAADGDGSGEIDASDYDLWRAYFGATRGSSVALSSAEPLTAAVPEPATAALLILAASVACFRRHQNNSRRKTHSREKHGVNRPFINSAGLPESTHWHTWPSMNQSAIARERTTLVSPSPES